MVTMAVIDVSNLSKYYGDVKANDGLTFTIEGREIFGYIGPNGAGKTTTIRMLLGLLSPSEGTATLFGYDVQEEGELIEAKSKIGYLPSDPGFNEPVSGTALVFIRSLSVAGYEPDGAGSSAITVYEPRAGWYEGTEPYRIAGASGEVRVDAETRAVKSANVSGDRTATAGI